MRTTNETIDFQRHMYDRDVDARIKASRDDMLHVVRADIRMLESKVDSNFDVLNSKGDSNFDVLNSKIDSNFDVLNSKIDNNTKRLEDKIDNVISMKKWVVGIFVTVLLAVVTLIAPNIVSFFAGGV